MEFFASEGAPGTSRRRAYGNMEIRVENWTHETMTFEVDSSIKVSEVAVAISELLDVPADEVRLRFSGRRMEIDKTLAEYGVQDWSLLSYVQCLGGGSSGEDIFVKVVTKGTMIFEVDGSIKVSDVVAAISKELVIPAGEVRLLFSGRLMEMDKTLAEYGVEDRSVLDYVRCLYGGGSRREILVETGSHGTMMFGVDEVDGFMKVSDVAAAISEGLHVPAGEVRLRFSGRQMEMDKTLAEYGVQDGSLLSYVQRLGGGGSGEKILVKTLRGTSRRRADGKMKIRVASLTNETMTFEVDDSSKVEDVAVAISEPLCVPADHVRLIFSGRQMEMGRTLGEYGVEDRSLIHLVWRLAGGGGCFSTEYPQTLPGKKIKMVDSSSVIWVKEFDRTLLDLMVKHTPAGGNNGQDFNKNAWLDIMREFNKATGLGCQIKPLRERLKFYKLEYQIVSKLRKHPKFHWDDQNHSVIATDEEWSLYIQENPEAKRYRKRRIWYFDRLEIICSS